MKPYLAIVKDSFREALYSPVLWIVAVLLTLVLLALAPIGISQQLNVRLGLGDIKEFPDFVKKLEADYQKDQPSPGKRLWSRFSEEQRKHILEHLPKQGQQMKSFAESIKATEELQQGLDKAIKSKDMYDEASWSKVKLGDEAKKALDKGVNKLSDEERQRFHRVLIDDAFPEFMQERPRESMLFSYATWELPALPLSRKDLNATLDSIVYTLNDWGVGVGLIVLCVLMTSPMIPRMFDQGQLHLLLSKPVSRSLLLISQFLGGCVYVFLLTSYTMIAIWLLLGTRLGYWNHRLLWLIPVYVCMFAVYYTVSAASAVIWKSTLVAILNTILFFIFCFLLGTGEFGVRKFVDDPHRITKIMAGRDDYLVSTQSGAIRAWNPKTNRWDLCFLPKKLAPDEVEMMKSMADMSGLVMVQNVGPIYVPQRDTMVGLQLSFQPGQTPQQTVALGNAKEEWRTTAGVPSPMGSFAIYCEPEGHVLVASSLGLYRLVGDPTAQPEPPKVLGFKLPIPALSAFRSVGPESGLAFGPSALTAYHPASRQFAAFSFKKLMYLQGKANERYEKLAERALATEKETPTALAIGKDVVLVGYENRKVEIYSLPKLELKGEYKPDTSSAPQTMVSSPSGEEICVLYQNGRLWRYKSDTDQWATANVRGQGHITGVAYGTRGELIVAQRGQCVTTYDPSTYAVNASLWPKMSVIETGYYYVLLPLYTILPKPGEFYHTSAYLLTGKEKISTVFLGEIKVNPWAPVWSGLAFIVVGLGLTCIYFERQGY